MENNIASNGAPIYLRRNIKRLRARLMMKTYKEDVFRSAWFEWVVGVINPYELVYDDILEGEHICDVRNQTKNILQYAWEEYRDFCIQHSFEIWMPYDDRFQDFLSCI